MKWLSFIVLLFLCACTTPQKQLSKLLRKHPELIRRDTVWTRDTTIIKEVSADTVFSHLATRDTVVLQKDRLTVKYFYSRDSVYLSGDCAGDTIIKEVPVLVNSIQPQQDRVNYWPLAIIVVSVLLFGYALLRYLKS